MPPLVEASSFPEIDSNISIDFSYINRITWFVGKMAQLLIRISKILVHLQRRMPISPKISKCKFFSGMHFQSRIILLILTSYCSSSLPSFTVIYFLVQAALFAIENLFESEYSRVPVFVSIMN